MNIVKELEDVLKAPNFMGMIGQPGINLAVNAILDKIDNLGYDLVKREQTEYDKFAAKLNYFKDKKLLSKEDSIEFATLCRNINNAYALGYITDDELLKLMETVIK